MVFIEQCIETMHRTFFHYVLNPSWRAGSGLRHSQRASTSRHRPTMAVAGRAPINAAETAKLAAMPLIDSHLPRREMRPPFSQSRNEGPNRGCCNSRALSSGAPLPQAHRPMIRKTVVGINGMKTLINPMDTLIVPRVRHSHGRILADFASGVALFCRQDGFEIDIMFCA